MSESKVAQRPTATAPLLHDSAFWSMLITQFLGAFNDNLFKQLVLLICVDHFKQGGRDFQPLALALFAIPFVLFSGIGGYLSDRWSKRQIIVLCKAAEIAITLMGLLAFLSGQFAALFVVLFFMSTHSAFFGPPKYGILPELFRESDLPQVNGMIQMTTFVAIIFGMALAGYSKTWFQNDLWMVSVICIGIAVVGTITSLGVRKTAIACPGLRFTASALGINRDAWKLLRSDRQLFVVLMVATIFWFVGGVVQPSVNLFGKVQLGFNDARTSILAACMGVGIAVGCAIAGEASGGRANFRLVKLGAWGLAACLFATSLLGVSGASPQTIEILGWVVLTLLGAFGGFYIVPLQVFLQSRPPQELKGRMIGTMNLVNWIGIVLSAVFLQGTSVLLRAAHQPISWIFAATALIMLPIALFFRQGKEDPHPALSHRA